ncbi:7-cyano-7-deazaguanine synthase, partial [bacterium]|nr:7-cyano-7-deazaguanine synthase [bacterium]
IEIQRAGKIAATLLAAEHKVVKVDLRSFGGSVLTGNDPLPDVRENPGDQNDIPGTYVPARNTVLLSLALAWAEVLRAEVIFIGANAVDYSGYPDCRPEYLEAFQRLARLATKAGTMESWQLKIEAPLIDYSKARIVKLGEKLGVDFSLTISCYNPGPKGRPCGACEACMFRSQGFSEAGIKDKAEVYQ